MGWLSDLVESASELPGMVLTGAQDVAGMVGDIASGVGNVVTSALQDPTFLKGAALMAMGYYYMPATGAWTAANGATLSATEAGALADSAISSGIVDPTSVAFSPSPEAVASLGGGVPNATAFPIGSAAAATEAAAVPLTSTIAPAAAGAAAVAPAVTNALAGDAAAADLTAAYGTGSANALATGAGAGEAVGGAAAAGGGAGGASNIVTSGDLAAISGTGPEDLAWMDTVSPAQMAAIGTAELPGLSGFTLSSLAKLAKDYAVPLSMLASGLMGASTAKSAAQTQADAARYAADLQYKIFQEQKGLQEPYRQAGLTAQNQLLTYLGLPGGTQGADYGKWNRPFGMSQFQADPGYAFRLSEGMKALEASRAAKGGLLGGATGKALTRYGQIGRAHV